MVIKNQNSGNSLDNVSVHNDEFCFHNLRKCFISFYRKYVNSLFYFDTNVFKKPFSGTQGRGRGEER